MTEVIFKKVLSGESTGREGTLDFLEAWRAGA